MAVEGNRIGILSAQSFRDIRFGTCDRLLDMVPGLVLEKNRRRAQMEKMMTRGHLLVARLGRRSVGLLGLYANDRETGTAWVVYAAVDPRFRRRGVARALFARAFAIVRQAHLSCTSIYVLASNAPARALYADLGFREVWRGTCLGFKSIRMARLT